MTPSELNTEVLTPALALLPARMDSPQARAMLITIGLQESALIFRRQMNNGPAKGLWQFERGGGVKGVMTHPAAREHTLNLCNHFDIPVSATAIWDALEVNDVFAATIARVLLWTDPLPLPDVGDATGSWALYERVWRPGKPHPAKWLGNRVQAAQAVGG